MRVSLKKAAALASALAAVSVSIPTGVQASIYSDADLATLIAQAAAAQNDAVKEARNNAMAVYRIRSLIGEANAGRINSLLTERAAIDKQLQILNAVSLVEKQPDIEALTRRLAALRDAPQERTYGGRTEELVIPIPNGNLISPALKALKKERIGIEDELAHLNFTTEIQLPDDVVTILRENDLI